VISFSPSKFGKGIPLLWKGNKSILVKNALVLNKVSENEAPRLLDHYLYESARSAIYNFLVSQNVGAGDEVILSAFTCDAVSFAVLRCGATPVYVDINDDLSMNSSSVLAAVTDRTKAVIMQNTLGRLGLSVKTQATLRENGMLIIEDCALAIGSANDNVLLGSFGDVSVWSAEVSKTFTIGWGGVLTINHKPLDKFANERYSVVGEVSKFEDLRRVMQLWLSLKMTELKLPGAVLLWYFLYGFRIFRRSNCYDLDIDDSSERIGKYTRKIFYNSLSVLDEVYKRTNSNYLQLQELALSLDLNVPVVQQKNEFIVSPRFSILVSEESVDEMVVLGAELGVEVGRWFCEAPPAWGIKSCEVHSAQKANLIAKRIINLPCHWTIEKGELEQLKAFIRLVADKQ